MLINLLSQLGIIATLLASLTQQVEVIQLQVEELLTPQVVEEVVEEPKTKGWFYLEEPFQCLGVNDELENIICECQFREYRNEGIGMRDIIKKNCQPCDEFVEQGRHLFYDPDTDYIEALEGYCIEKPCKYCEDKSYWTNTTINCKDFKNGCLKGWDKRKWQEHHPFICWLDKCVERPIDMYRYLDKTGYWLEVEPPESYEFYQSTK